MTCNKCKEDNTIKYGMRNGMQCYLCKKCNFQFTSDYSYIEKEKRAALTLGCLGLSFRKIGELIGCSHVTIRNWIKSFEITKTNKDKAATVGESSISIDESQLMNIEDICIFLDERNDNAKVGKKSMSLKEGILWNGENELMKYLAKIIPSIKFN